MIDFAQELSLWSQKSCRSHLESRDIEFIQSVLGIELEFEPHLIQSLLSDDKLFFHVLESTEQLPISPQLYFSILLQRTFLKANINNAFLLDYIVFVLTTNLKTNSFHNEFYITDYLEKINLAQGKEKFYLRIELSNQILFFTGLFQDFMHSRCGNGSISFYESIGSNQYNVATSHPLADKLHLKNVFSQLSHDFSHVRQSLHLMSENLLSLGEPFTKHFLI